MPRSRGYVLELEPPYLWSDLARVILPSGKPLNSRRGDVGELETPIARLNLVLWLDLAGIILSGRKPLRRRGGKIARLGFPELRLSLTRIGLRRNKPLFVRLRNDCGRGQLLPREPRLRLELVLSRG